MFYRVDYVVAVMLAGLAFGLLVNQATSNIKPSRLARFYFVIVAILVVLRVVVFACSVVLPGAKVWSIAGNAMGDTSNFLVGFLFGIALLRVDRREILCDPAVYSILCISAGVGFVMTGYAKALYMQGMVQFFTQSGYSVTFLKFIMTAEVLGGAALLIPVTVLPALAGLSIDMFGAVYTHIHNGDPLNDSTGAIATLIRFAVIAALWAWRSRSSDEPGSVRRRLVGVAAVAACCAVVAVGGSAIVRARSASATAGRSHAANCDTHSTVPVPAVIATNLAPQRKLTIHGA